MPDCSLAWAQPNMVIAVDIWVYISTDPVMSQLSISVSILNPLEPLTIIKVISTQSASMIILESDA